MRFDTLTEFSVDQTLTGTSADSTNTVDLGAAGIAEGPTYIVVTVLTDSVEDLAVELVGSDDNSTFKTLSKRSFATGKGGDQVTLAVPSGCGRYLKLIYTGTSMTGTVHAGLTLAATSAAGKRIEDYAAN